MSRIDVTIKTRDGSCPASFFTPSAGNGPWPGVVFFMDGPGIRPALWNMGQQLADMGYAVLLPDLYYRSGSYAPMVPAEVFADPAKRERLMQMVGSLNRDRKVSDADAFIAFLAQHPQVQGERFGATGYCMGGNVAVTAAGAHKERFAAIASFHAGGLVTDSPDSPHRFLQGVQGEVYVAGADEDTHFTDAQKFELEAALATAGVKHEVVTYFGAHHGYAVPDHPAYHAEAAARHWQAMQKLFGTTLA